MEKRHILCYGDSNTHGYSAETGGRFDDDTRWTRVLQKEIGNDVLVFEEGLSGRTTVFSDPLNESMNGLADLAMIMTTHEPLDLLILMLGTNDTKERYSATPQNIANGVDCLIKKAKQTPAWRRDAVILIVAPIIIDPRMYACPYINGEMGSGSAEKSNAIIPLIQATAETNGVFFMDCNACATPNTIDFMHFDGPSHRRFGMAAAEKVREILHLV
ncbi:MAG: SGNH/GDSL hydrolase family protein [Ruthenibacterium sp.]